MRAYIQVNNEIRDVTDDLISIPELNQSYDEHYNEVKVDDVRIELSNIDRNYDYLLRNLEFAILILKKEKIIFRGYIDIRFESVEYDVFNERIRLSFISIEKKFWDKCENLSIRNLKAKSKGWLTIPPVFYSLGDLVNRISQLTGFRIDAGEYKDILLGNGDDIAKFDYLDDEISIKEFLLEISKYYGFVILYDADEDMLKFVNKSGKFRDFKINADNLSSFYISYGGEFYDFVKIENYAWVAKSPSVIDMYFTATGLVQNSTYTYVIIEENINGELSKPAFLYVTTLNSQDIKEEGRETWKVAVVLLFPKTYDNVKKRIVYRSMFNNPSFYKLVEIQGNGEIRFEDNIEDSSLGAEQYVEQVSSKFGYFYFDSEGRTYFTSENLEGMGYKIFSYDIKLKFKYENKSYSDFSFVIKMLEPFGIDLTKIIERLRYLFSRFYIYKVRLSDYLDVNILDVVDVVELNNFSNLKNAQSKGKIIEVTKKEDETELKIIVNQYKINAIEI